MPISELAYTILDRNGVDVPVSFEGRQARDIAAILVGCGPVVEGQRFEGLGILVTRVVKDT